MDLELLKRGLRSEDLTTKMKALDVLIDWIRKEEVREEAIEPLNDLLLDENPDIRRMATWALGKLAMSKVGSEDSIPLLNTLLEDEDGKVRENAAWSLGELAGAGFGDRSSV